MTLELVKDDVMIELEDIGEGWNGDYNEEDPEDQPLLRFTVYRKLKSDILPWEQVDDASYCTALPVETDPAILQKALSYLMDEFYEPVKEEITVKKLAERLSWISPDDFS